MAGEVRVTMKVSVFLEPTLTGRVLAESRARLQGNLTQVVRLQTLPLNAMEGF